MYVMSWNSAVSQVVVRLFLNKRRGWFISPQYNSVGNIWVIRCTHIRWRISLHLDRLKRSHLIYRVLSLRKYEVVNWWRLMNKHHLSEWKSRHKVSESGKGVVLRWNQLSISWSHLSLDIKASMMVSLYGAFFIIASVEANTVSLKNWGQTTSKYYSERVLHLDDLWWKLTTWLGQATARHSLYSACFRLWKYFGSTS